MRPSDPCDQRIELGVEGRPANALNVEIGAPLPRCRLKTPGNWQGSDKRAVRWLWSGGSPLVLGPCSSRCPLDRRRVGFSDAHALAVQALEAGLVLHGYDSIGEKYVTAGRDIRAVGCSLWAIYEGVDKLECASATEVARALVGTAQVPGVLGTYPTWGAATVALEKAGLL